MPEDADKGRTEYSQQFGLVTPAPKDQPVEKRQRREPAKAKAAKPTRSLGASVGKLLREALEGLGGS